MSSLAPVGDRGQRYEVRQIRHDRTQMTFGWTNDPGGGVLARSAALHPSTGSVEIIDRGPANSRVVGWHADIPQRAPDVYAPVRAAGYARDQVLVILDARHACYRAYHTRELSSSAGEVTSCLHGVLEMTRAICEAANTRRWVLCWDGTLEYKRRLYPAYKRRHDRAMTPEETEEREKRERAIATVKDFMAAAGAPSIHIPDAEADDAAGIAAVMWTESAAARRVCADPRVVVLSDDKDYYQLISPRVSVWRGVMKQLIDEATFRGMFAFAPPAYVDYKALVGEPEAGDNIPGVSGIGDITAAKLIGAHGSIYNVIKHCGERVASVAKPLRSETNIHLSRQDALLSLRLSSIAMTAADLGVLGCDAARADREVKRGLNLACKISRPLGDIRPALSRLGFVSFDLNRWAESCGFARA